ncbi:MAG: hypothetical protein IPG66_18485 [Hydrogenophilales bacterium]|nr:hypothetical protein [Hydrogenophilales bacterium]
MLDSQIGGSQCVVAHHWLDRESAWHWRSGDFEIAYAIQRCKRDQALDMGEDGQRELARLLWMASWLRHPDALALFDEATAVLGPDQLDTLHQSGNDDFKYLFRAHALAAWRFGMREKNPGNARSRLIESLSESSLDPGANATTLLILECIDGQAEWPMELALQRLADAGYLLEAGYWGQVHGRHEFGLGAFSEW